MVLAADSRSKSFSAWARPEIARTVALKRTKQSFFTLVVMASSECNKLSPRTSRKEISKHYHPYNWREQGFTYFTAVARFLGQTWGRNERDGDFTLVIQTHYAEGPRFERSMPWQLTPARMVIFSFSVGATL